MISVPLLLVVIGALWWLLGGRYVSTDNAYVHQDLVTIGSDVAGRIAAVRVRENEHVTAGQVLFELDAAPYRIALANAEANVAKQRLQVEQLRAAYHAATVHRFLIFIPTNPALDFLVHLEPRGLRTAHYQ